MPPVEAASGWCVVPGARHAASAYLPSISSMLSGSVKDSQIWQTRPQSVQTVCANALGRRFPGYRRSFPVIQLPACWMKATKRNNALRNSRTRSLAPRSIRRPDFVSFMKRVR